MNEGLDADALIRRLRSASNVFAHAGPPHGDIALLLADAAIAIEHLSMEVRLQRGMAVAAQALAGELSARLDGRGDEDKDEGLYDEDEDEELYSPPPPRRACWSPHRTPSEERWPTQHACAGDTNETPTGRCGSGSVCADGHESLRLSEDADDGGARVEALVDALKTRFRQSGVPLPLVRQSGSGTVYRLGSRRVSLGVREGRLTVLSASGEHTDLLEYLSRSAS